MSGEGTVVVKARIRMPPPEGLRRDRLVRPLSRPGAQHIAVVVAPAGCGKTTLLSHLAEVRRGPVGWLTLDDSLADEAALLGHLQLALLPVLGSAAAGPRWVGSEDMLAALEGSGHRDALLVLDDAHCIRGRRGTDIIRLLATHRPPSLLLALGSRTPLDVDRWSFGLRRQIVAIDADALRFRTWEVEELFRQLRRTGLRPEECALLTRRTGGWAAGLQLFDLATAQMPPSARSRLLSDASRSAHLTREYLAAQVVAGLPGDLRSFVLRSAVLRRLTPEVCNRVLEITDARDALAALAARGLVSIDPAGHEGEYGHHDVLRTALLGMASTELGERPLADLHRRAGAALRSDGQDAEAIRSFASANDWAAVGEVVAARGRELADLPGSWLDVLPAALSESDPWVALAAARRMLAEGDLPGALAAYERAEALVGPGSWDGVAGEESRALAMWVDPPMGEVDSWVFLARRALADPVAVVATTAAPRAGAGRGLARGLALLVTGQAAEAAEVLGVELAQVAMPPSLEAVALLAQAVALSLAADPQAALVRLQAARAAADLGAPALQRLNDGLDLASSGHSPVRIRHLLLRCREAGDLWGALVLRLITAVAALPERSCDDLGVPTLATELTAVGAPALAVWASVCAAVSGPDGAAGAAGAPTGELADLVREAAALGPLPHALALLAQRHPAGPPPAVPDEPSRHPSGAGAWLRTVSSRLACVDQDPGPDDRAAATGEPLHVRCLGGFHVQRGGRPVELAVLRPRHRALLRVLCLHAGAVVHRERLMGWFWPDHDPARATRNLQVAISAVRRLVEEEGGTARLRRDGEGYRLDLGAGTCDVVTVRSLLADVARARAAGDPARFERALDAVLAAATEDLLPDDGPAEWVVAEREDLRLAVVAAAEALADVQSRSGRHADAARTASIGLRHDRHSDLLWSRLVDALDMTGRPAEAAAARRRYAEVLDDLLVGVPR